MTIEIIGRASVAPGAPSIQALQQVLEEGRCTVDQIPDGRWNLARYWHPMIGTIGKTYTYAAGVVDGIHDFDPTVFGLSQREAMQMDPQQRILLGLVWRALEDANIVSTGLAGERVGVYVGASSLDNGNLSAEDPSSGSPYFMTGNTLSIVSNRISHIFGLRGPSMTIDTACSSSLVALDQAVKALERDDIDTAIVGGINLLAHPLSFVGFAQARMLSPEGLCRAYDTNGHGYVRAEGGAVVILRRTDRALREKDRSYARIHAVGVNSSGRTNGISLPSREAQAALLRSVYESQNIDVNRIAFIEGHGTGTRVGDPAEVWAIGNVIGKERHAPVPIGSIKTNIGHTEPASGMFGLLKAVLALENNMLPASLHVEKVNEDIDFEALNVRVNTAAIELLPAKRARFAGINSFGFGGTNAHVVISDPDKIAPPEPTAKAEDSIFLASAHTSSALGKLLEDYRTRLSEADPKQARQIATAAVVNREALRHRFVVKARDSKSVEEAIALHLAGEPSYGERGEVPSGVIKIAFVFSGNGSQWAGMGVEAYRENSHFRQCFQSFSALFEYYLGEKLTDLLEAEDLAKRLVDTKIAQPLLFAVQASVSDCLVAMGVKPEIVFGHSVGEIAAAYAAKALTAAEAVAIVAKRSQHQDLLAGAGKMAAVVLGPDAALAFAKSHGLENICIAAVNAASSVTISGPVAEIEAFREIARKSQIIAHVLDINYPFHHPIIDRAKDAFLADLPDVQPEAGTGAFVSTVTGNAFDGRQLDAHYWWRNVRDPVLFKDAAETALAVGCNLFIEISPRPILSNYITEIAKQATVQAAAIATLLREAPVAGRDPIAKSFARAVAHGAPALRSRSSVSRNAFITLPALPFEQVELRPVSTIEEVNLFGRDHKAPFTLLGWRTDPNGSTWQNHFDAHLFADLAEHVVDSKAILPGSGFIEIAVTAAQQYYKTPRAEITNLEIVRPLELRQDRMVELLTVLSPETGDIEIRSRERLSNDDWTVHAVARSRKPVDAAAEIRANRPAGELKTILTSEKTYETAEQFGLHYGPHFQLLSKAVAYGRTLIEVDLKPAAKPTHPYITYNLNPMSVDAAFHGLVALFDQLSGDQTGAPYIPVRFGKISVSDAGRLIVKATIEIERFSQNSIKVRFRLFDSDNVLVAAFDDCRFRRTYLRRHSTLDSVAFHYQSVPSSLDAISVASLSTWKGLPRHDDTKPLNNASLLIDAAVYRACHEIGLSLAGGQKVVSRQRLPGDAAFRAFLTSCLFILEDAGIATSEGDHWIVPREFTLPSMDELLGELYKEDAGRVAEAVLVNDAYCEALQRLAPKAKQDVEQERGSSKIASDATLDHVLVHSPLSRRRQSVVMDAVVKAFEGQRPVRRLMEVGSTSPAFSRRLATLAAENNALLMIVEPRENIRRALELAFERDVNVLVIEPSALGEQPPADIIVASGDQSQRLLQSHEALRAAISVAAAKDAMIIFADRAPSVFNDFAFGLADDWFTEGSWEAFPIGQLGTIKQVEDSIRSLGFDAVVVEECGFPEGAIVFASATASTVASTESKAPLPEMAILLVTEKRRPAISLAGVQTASIGLNAGRVAYGEAMQRFTYEPVHALYLAERKSRSDVTELMVDRLQTLTGLAEALTARQKTGSPRARLIIVAPGGSPLAGTATDEANAGLWALARVVANEYDLVDVHVIDADEKSQPIALAQQLMVVSTANREWRIDPETRALSEIRAASGAVPSQEKMLGDYPAATIRQHSHGRLDSVAWEACDLPVPAPDEVVVEVAATGLNFRDVMWAMGVLPEEALEDGFAGATIGMELSGRVASVGSDVVDLVPGDKVMGIGPAAFSTHARVKREGVTKVGEHMDVAAAATVPVAFLTAYYAMIELGHIQPGEVILIHGAAGGVGLAALQIAKLKGAVVIATAGSPEKRRFLERLGADHIFDSRSMDFVSRVRNVTSGQGVDLVLNSLFSEAMERSLELVKPFGRFLELGKRDYYSDRKIGLRPFRRNISYFGIDADQLLINAPALTRRIFAEIGALFEAGKLSPLPYRSFSHDEIGSAFRLMQNSGHIGKIIVRPPLSGVDKVQAGPGRPLRLSSEGIFLVVGGIGGFGLGAADWLVSKGAGRIALCSRKGVADADTVKLVAEWKKKGVIATVHACDVTDEAATKALLETLRQEAPIKGVVHAAMVLNDALLSNLTPERNRPVIDVKVRGAEILSRLTAKDEVELFLLFSSATTMIGNTGQGNYVAANGYLEGLARTRRKAGLPALAVGFGAISDKGFLARNIEVNDLLAKRIGKTAMKAGDALEQVERYMVADTGTIDAAAVMIAEIDWSAVRLLPIASTSIFEALMRNLGTGQNASDGEGIDLEAMIRGKSEDEAQTILHGVVAAEIAAILRVTESDITPEKVLKDIGLDSLMAMELGMSFQQKTGFDIPLSGVGDGTTVGDVVTRLRDRVMNRSADTEEGPPMEEDKVVSQLVRSHSVPQAQAAGGQ